MIRRARWALSAIVLASVLGMAPRESHAQADAVASGALAPCGFTIVYDTDGSGNAAAPPTRPGGASLPPSRAAVEETDHDLCYALTLGTRGWLEPMQLHLNEGAREFLPFIKLAADSWNRILPADIIVVREEEVAHAEYGPSPASRAASGYYRDLVSTVYFTEVALGHARIYPYWDSELSANVIAEADVFVTKPSYIITGIGTVSTLIHELGHALGLGHLSISDSMMSYDRGLGLRERFEPLLKLGLFPPEYGVELRGDADWAYFYRDERFAAGIMDRMFGPSDIDKLMLSCMYGPSWPGVPGGSE